MIPGTILFDDNFRFRDGQKGEKLFVVLSDGSDGLYSTAKTTSRGKLYLWQYGCQIGHRYPAFYLPLHATCLRKDTWVQLEAFYDFESAALVQKVISGLIKRIGVLDSSLAVDLIECARRSQDITPPQESRLQDAVVYLQGTET